VARKCHSSGTISSSSQWRMSQERYYCKDVAFFPTKYDVQEGFDQTQASILKCFAAAFDNGPINARVQCILL
jgi:hypothetical protein